MRPGSIHTRRRVKPYSQRAPDNEPSAMQDQPGDPRGELRAHERGEQVASLDRRIEALEMLYASSTAEEHTAAERGRKELIHKAILGALDAMAHIKRAPIDREEWR